MRIKYFFHNFKRSLLVLFIFCLPYVVQAQCSVCTQTAGSLEENAAKGLNAGIIYLALLPMTILFVIAYLFYKKSKQPE